MKKYFLSIDQIKKLNFKFLNLNLMIIIQINPLILLN